MLKNNKHIAILVTLVFSCLCIYQVYIFCEICNRLLFYTPIDAHMMLYHVCICV